MKIKFHDLSESTRDIKQEFLERVGLLLDKASFILGDEVEGFENAWAKYIGTEHAIGVSNGSDALWLALTALGVKPGDEVITQGNAYNATVTAILRAGAVPRFADIDPETFLINPAEIEPLITSKTKAILPVHLYGQASNMSAIMEIAKKDNLFVVEDCAQAHGATWQGKKVGAFGDAAAWSFYPTKPLGAFGDAGAVTTSSATIAEEVRFLRNLGQQSKNDHVRLGYNMRLDPIQAIALSVKLNHLDTLTKKREAVASYYNELITSAKLLVRHAKCHTEATHVFHLYPIVLATDTRDEARTALREQGIETAIHYPELVMNQPFYPNDLLKDPCPIAESVARSIFSLPLHEGISREEQEYIVQTLKSALA